MRVETSTRIAKSALALRMVLTNFLLLTQDDGGKRLSESKAHSIKSAYSCTIRIPRTIPAITPREKISSISLIVVSPEISCVPLARRIAARLETRMDSKLDECE